MNSDQGGRCKNNNLQSYLYKQLNAGLKQQPKVPIAEPIYLPVHTRLPPPARPRLRSTPTALRLRGLLPSLLQEDQDRRSQGQEQGGHRVQHHRRQRGLSCPPPEYQVSNKQQSPHQEGQEKSRRRRLGILGRSLRERKLCCLQPLLRCSRRTTLTLRICCDISDLRQSQQFGQGDLPRGTIQGEGDRGQDNR